MHFYKIMILMIVAVASRSVSSSSIKANSMKNMFKMRMDQLYGFEISNVRLSRSLVYWMRARL